MNAIGPSSKVTVSPRVYARSFGEEVVLLDFAAGDYYGLDPVGAEVWRRLEAGEALGAIVDAMAAEYDAAADVIEADVLALVRALAERSLVTAE